MTFPILGGNGAVTGFSIDNSLRFNDGDNPRLTRTMATGTSRRIFTFSTWLKRSHLGTFQYVFTNSPQSSFDAVRINSDDTLDIRFNDNAFTVRTNRVYRDVSSWYHILVAVDTTQSTASDRVKIYTNGSLETSLAGTTYPTQNYDTSFGVSGQEYQVSTNTWNDDQAFDGYLAETHFIDGQALSPTSFGEFDEDSGIWKPKEYDGSYGTNGFYLDFENSGSLGADQSGNGNNFTATNLASTDQMLDSPTNNWCTFNSITATATGLSEGNLKSFIDGDASSYPVNVGTIPMTSGKWYAEVYCVSGSFPRIGIFNVEADSTPDNLGGTSAGWCILNNASRKFHNGGASSYGSFTLGSGEIVGIAYDADNGKVWFSKNGTFVGTVDSSGEAFSGISGQITWAVADASSGSTQILNAGQDSSFAGSTTRQNNSDDNGFGDFYYAPPSGYLALCTQNLATELSPTIDDGSAYFHTQLYTGNRSSTQTITNDANAGDFQPDWLWIKHRNDTVAHSHNLIDSSRGATKHLYSNTTDAEGTVSNGLTSFNTDGFTIGNNPALNQPDRDVNYVAWQWKANGGTTSSNTDGSITSTVQANTTAGFSIVTYTGNRTAGATVGHGLGVAPSMVIAKSRTASAGWAVFHASLGGSNFVRLNETSASASNSVFWNNTAPSSSVVTLGGGDETNNDTGGSVMYCFAPITGYSAMGKYTGNGSTDGTFIYTGFKPAWIMFKNAEQAGGQWFIHDNKRETFNPSNSSLFAESSQAETANNSALDIDFLSNGFKKRNTGSGANNSGIKYIYMAFAENPFVDSNGVPNTAR